MNAFVAFLIIMIPILLISSTIDYFLYRNWRSIYIALNDESYYRAISDLKRAGIRYKTKTSFNHTISPMFGGSHQRQYEIYVKEIEADFAAKKLHF